MHRQIIKLHFITQAIVKRYYYMHMHIYVIKYTIMTKISKSYACTYISLQRSISVWWMNPYWNKKIIVMVKGGLPVSL